MITVFAGSKNIECTMCIGHVAHVDNKMRNTEAASSSFVEVKADCESKEARPTNILVSRFWYPLSIINSQRPFRAISLEPSF